MTYCTIQLPRHPFNNPHYFLLLMDLSGYAASPPTLNVVLESIPLAENIHWLGLRH